MRLHYFLTKLNDLTRCNGYLLFHVSDKEILVQLMDVRDALNFHDVCRLLLLGHALSSASSMRFLILVRLGFGGLQ